MAILFDNFKQLLTLIATDSYTVNRNVVLQNAAFSADLSAHIAALTPDRNIALDTTQVESTTGLLVNDANAREIRFEPKGSDKIAQGFLEANVVDVRKLWQRSDDAAGTATGIPYSTFPDGRRYYATDAGRGVFYLNQYGQIIGAVPGFGNTVTGYGVPSSAITFSVGATEYVAICSAASHIVRIYNTVTFALVATFGTPGIPGLPSVSLLDSPQDLAFDASTSTLYVACSGGTPPGATGVGFIASFNFSAPPVLTFGSYVAINDGSDLHQGSVVDPRGIFYDSTLSALWVLSANTTNLSRPFEIGALSVTGLASNKYLVGYIEYRGRDFQIRDASKLHVDVARRRLYVTNSPSAEVFDVATMRHLYTFGSFGQDENSNNLNAAVFNPMTGSLSSVCSDTLLVDGTLVSCLLFQDATNDRLVRIGENSYEGDNRATFVSMTFGVPLSLHGYLVKGNIASSKITIEYRTSSTGIWQVLSQTDSVPASVYFQFRVRINSDLSDVIGSRSIREILIIGKHE